MQGALQLAGKLGGLGSVNAIHPGNLIFIRDQTFGISFLVDTSALVSLLPGPVDLSSADALSLSAANGDCITTGSVECPHLLFSDSAASQHSFCCDFLVGEVSGPILGNDFLQAQGFCVDWVTCCLRHHGSCFPGASSFSLGVAAAVLPAGIGELEFPTIIYNDGQLPSSSHNVEHFLETMGPPVTAWFRRLVPAKLATAKHKFANWEATS